MMAADGVYDPLAMITFARPDAMTAKRARTRRTLGVVLQILGWMCGVLVILGAPFLPLIALLLLPFLDVLGAKAIGAGVIVIAFTVLFLLLPVSLCLVHLGGEMRCAPWLGRTCFRCGYDLRGSTHSQRCPECGSFI